MTLATSWSAPRVGPKTATALIMTAAVCFGSVPLFARTLTEAGVSSPAIAFYRFVFSLAIVCPFFPRSREKRRAALMATAAGLGVGLGWIGYLESLKVAPVAAAGVIYMSYPMFTVLFGWLLLGQRPSRRAGVASAMVLAAAALALSPGAVPVEAIPVLLTAFAAPVAFAVSIVVTIGMSNRLAPLERMSCILLGAVLGLAPLIAVTDGIDALVPATPAAWPLVAGLALITATIPQSVYSFAAPRVGPARTAMAGSFELPTMFAVGWLAFGETASAIDIVSASLVIGAIALTPVAMPRAR